MQTDCTQMPGINQINYIMRALAGEERTNLVDILLTPLYILLGGLVWFVLNRSTFMIAANICENQCVQLAFLWAPFEMWDSIIPQMVWVEHELGLTSQSVYVLRK